MNRAELVFAVCHMIGIRAVEGERRGPAGSRLIDCRERREKAGRSARPFRNSSLLGGLVFWRDAVQGSNPNTAAPMIANAAQIMIALIGLVSPIIIASSSDYVGESKPAAGLRKGKLCCTAAWL